MKYFLLLALVTSSVTVTAQDNWSIGLRMGDPAGFTAKKYMGNNALEFNIGRSHWLSGAGRYNNRFNDWYQAQNLSYTHFQYVNYRTSSALGIQVHYLFHYPLSEVLDEDIAGLDWYWGVGGQFRFQSYRYDYRFKVDGDPNWYYETGPAVTDVDLGCDGVIGLEYTFSEVPISVFTDVTLFVELIDDPFQFHTQAGLGGRYNF